jgi:hypothetical protein
MRRHFGKITRGPDIITDRIPEWKLQAAVCADLERRKSEGQRFEYAASLEGVIGNLNPYQSQLAKATGSKAGEPDLRLYFDLARLRFVELKAKDGRLKQSQKERIPLLEALGFTVDVVEAETEAEAVAKVGAIVDAELAASGV